MIASAPVRTSLATLLIAAATPSLAGELCVTCSDPVATYRCQLEGADPAASLPAAAQVLCIKEIATRGGHTSCSVSRDQSGAPCNGMAVTVAVPSIGPLKPAAKSAEPPPQIAGAPAPPPAPPANATDAPPATMEALAKEAAKQTKKDLENTTEAAGEGVKKAGASVETAVKKTWKCLSSLFTAC